MNTSVAEAQDDWECCGTASGRPRSDSSTEFGSEQSLLDDDLEDNRSDSLSKDAAPGFTPQETLFLFDWDDTLLPTTWLERRGLLSEQATASEEERLQFERLSAQVALTLRVASQRGRVVVVTNAMEGWVQHSCRRFMPSVVEVLEPLKIVSARSSFEPLGVRSPTQWKVKAFSQEVLEAKLLSSKDGGGGGAATQDPGSAEQRLNVISVGDSPHEHKALLRVTGPLTRCCAKSVKFLQGASIAQMLEEHELVAGTLEDIVQHEGDLDVDVGGSV